MISSYFKNYSTMAKPSIKKGRVGFTVGVGQQQRHSVPGRKTTVSAAAWQTSGPKMRGWPQQRLAWAVFCRTGDLKIKRTWRYQPGPRPGQGLPQRHRRENILESSDEVLLLGSEAMVQDFRGKLLLKRNYYSIVCSHLYLCDREAWGYMDCSCH